MKNLTKTFALLLRCLLFGIVAASIVTPAIVLAEEDGIKKEPDILYWVAPRDRSRPGR